MGNIEKYVEVHIPSPQIKIINDKAVNYQMIIANQVNEVSHVNQLGKADVSCKSEK